MTHDRVLTFVVGNIAIINNLVQDYCIRYNNAGILSNTGGQQLRFS